MGNGRTLTEIKVLGPLTVVAPDGPRYPGGETARLILALLATNVGRVVTYGRLTEGLWGEDPPATARKTLQVHVSNLRQRLGDAAPIITSTHGYTLCADGVSVDAVLFETEVAEACAVVDHDPSMACSMLARALDRWSGQAYADLVDHDAIRPEVARLDEIRMRATERRIEGELAQGHSNEVLADLAVLTTEFPYREHLHGLQILALYRSGRQAEALRHYERTRRRLSEELGIDPSPQLRDLHIRVLEHSPDLDDVGATSTAQPPGGAKNRGFRLRECLGKRRDGTVYRAVQSSLGRDVALEVNDAVEVGAPMLATMDHPHLVSVIDAWSEHSTSYIAMPLFSGTLAQWDTEKWTEREALLLVTQVGRALQHLHDHGVVHGAVRPDNILLDEEGNAFLTDADREAEAMAANGEAWLVDLESLATLALDLLSGCGPQSPSVEVAHVIDLARVADPATAHSSVSAFIGSLAGAVFSPESRPMPATAC